jgi:hypothetical protein
VIRSSHSHYVVHHLMRLEGGVDTYCVGSAYGYGLDASGGIDRLLGFEEDYRRYVHIILRIGIGFCFC